MESLLQGITKERAEVVIIDITGVPSLDAAVAGSLIQAVRAARLLGARVVVVGISPAIAQAMLLHGVDLTGIVTMANLQAGLEHALELRGLAIQPRAPASVY
jgi:rsbT co-antagonist protein RsbR